MTTSSESPAAAAPASGSGRGALGFAGVLLAVLALLLIGTRAELTQTFGLAGEPGRFTAQTCGRDLQFDGSTTRAQCLGTVEPDDGAAPYRAALYYDGSPGETYDVRTDPDSRTAYRTDVLSRWSAVSLPLVPVGLLWLAVGVWWAFRRPGVLSRGERRLFLGVFGAPTAAVLAVAAAGFLVSLTLT